MKSMKDEKTNLYNMADIIDDLKVIFQFSSPFFFQFSSQPHNSIFSVYNKNILSFILQH